MMSARMSAGESYDEGAIAAATNVLFQNDDLTGLMQRAAQRAFSHKIRDIFAENGLEPVGVEVEEIIDMLSRAPTSTSVAGGVNLMGAETFADVGAPMMAQAQAQISDYQEQIAARQKTFRKVKRLVTESGNALGEIWLEELANELVRAGEGDASRERIDTAEALRVIQLIGLCSNGQTISVTGLAAECEDKFNIVSKEVATLFEKVSAAYTEALKREDDHGRDIERTIVEKGRFARTATTALASDILSRRRGRQRAELPPLRPIQLLGTRAGGSTDDEEDLN